MPMKFKYWTIAIVFLVMAFFSSCSRDYYCKCIYTYTGAGHPPDQEELITIKGSKKYAEETCSGHSQVFVNEDNDTTVAMCDLY